MVDSIFKVQKAGSYYPSIDVFFKNKEILCTLCVLNLISSTT